MRVAKLNESMESLATRLVALEEDAYREFARLFGFRLRAFFLKRGLSETEAEDLSVNCVTDIALKVEKYHSLEGGCFEAWVFTLAKHALSDWRRRHEETLPLDDERLSAADDEIAANVSIIAAINQAIPQLAEKDQLLIRLRYFGEEHTYADIGQHLGLNANAVKVRHFRALKRLEMILREDPRISKILKEKTISER